MGSGGIGTGDAGSSGSGGSGGTSYAVDPEALREAAKQWYELSDGAVKVAETPVPTDLGFARNAASVPSLGTSATEWATKASAEYRSIGDKLMSAAENYSTTEQFSTDEALKAGH